LEALFECLIRQQNADCPAELSSAASLVAAIVYLLAQCYYKNPKSNRQPWNTADNAQILRRCIVYIDTHYTQSLSADALAKKFGLSQSTLSAAFQQHTGLPVHKYIVQKRIQKAQMLIRSHEDMALSDIAAKCGYVDNSTFYRNFLRVTGITPTKYKELCHDKNQ
jgi:AraC-like DNA-binding protein